MPKRKTAEEKLEMYRKKVRRLERRTFRRIQFISSSDSEAESSIVEAPMPDTITPCAKASEDATQTPEVPATTLDTADDVTLDTPAAAPEIDPSILAALGEINEDAPEYGAKINENLAKIWTPLLKKGLTKDNRESLLKKYRIPENCTFLQAPTLNPEVIMAIPESGKFRDKKMAASQQQLGAGITAISRGLDLLLTNANPNNLTVETIKFISDGVRVLTDLHQQSTDSRKKFVIPSLDKSFLQFVETTERDSTLFGVNLSENIRSSQTITKQGQQILRKASVAPRPSTSSLPTTTARTSFQGNAGGPSRYQSNRGARGGYKRTSHRAPPTSSTSTQSRTSTRSRAPPRR